MKEGSPTFDLGNMDLKTLVLGDLPKIRQAQEDREKEFMDKFGELEQIHRVVEITYENRPNGKWEKISESRGRDHVIADAGYEPMSEVLCKNELEESVQSVMGTLNKIIEKKREASHGK